MEVINESVASCHHLKLLMIPCRGQFVPLTKSPSDSVQRRLLSIKMAFFMDRVSKNQLLSTKRAVFVDKM